MNERRISYSVVFVVVGCMLMWSGISMESLNVLILGALLTLMGYVMLVLSLR